MGTPYSVNFVDGCWTALLDAGRTCPIKPVGVPVTLFAPGWRTNNVVDLGLDVHLLKAMHDSKQKAIWFFEDAARERVQPIAVTTGMHQPSASS